MSAAPVLHQVRASTAETAGERPELITSLAFYRKYTERLLRQYMRRSMEMGRTPSIVGNCIFRGKVSSYRLHSFEDAVIFVFDVEKCLKRLDKFSQELVARIALQEYSQGETAALTGQSLRSIVRKYGEAIDTLTKVFLEYKLLVIETGNPVKRAASAKNPQPIDVNGDKSSKKLA